MYSARLFSFFAFFSPLLHACPEPLPSSFLPVFSPFRCSSRLSALCFGPSMSTPHSCVDLTCDAILSRLHACFCISLSVLVSDQTETSKKDGHKIAKLLGSGSNDKSTKVFIIFCWMFCHPNASLRIIYIRLIAM